MRLALDTNILVYAEGAGPEWRGDAARESITKLQQHEIVLPAQVLGELYNVLTRKNKRSELEALASVQRWAALFEVASPTWRTYNEAIALAARAKLQVWDSVIMATAAEADCRLLLTEDLHDGFVYRGMTVVSPFAQTPHAALKDILGLP